MTLSRIVCAVLSIVVVVAILVAIFLFVRPRMVPYRSENNPTLLQFQGDGEAFALAQPLNYLLKRTGEKIVVPAGFVTDYASVPWALRSIISPLGRHSVPAIVHDYLYWTQDCSRLQSDLLLYETMTEYGSSWLEKVLVYRAVRMGAGGAWSGNSADRQRGLPRVVPSQNGQINIPPNAEWSRFRQQLFDKGVRAEPTGKSSKRPAYCSGQ